MAALSLAALSLSGLTPAHAGSYSAPVYTGGNAYQAAYTGHPVVPYALGSSTFQGGNYGGYGGDAGGTVNASCTGTITTTFTWQPDPGQTLTSDPPPLNVILQETCMAAASGNSIPAATVGGSCDNGLGVRQASLTQTVTPYGSPPIFYTEYGSGLVNSTRYQIIAGTATITLTRTPSATVSCLQGVNASLRYTASASPVILTLSGTTKDSNGNNILIGQGCTGTLTAIGYTLSNFQWTIPGDTFKSFVMGNSSGSLISNSEPYSQVNYLLSADLTQPSPHWFWKHGADFGEPQTVFCTAQASINGVVIGTVKGQKTVLVWKPYYKFLPNARGVTIVGTPGVSGVEVVGNIDWSAAVGTPDLFRAYWGGPGIWQFTQLCSIYRYAPPPVLLINNSGRFVLDAEFNYSSKDGAPWPADSTSDIPDERTSGDAPTEGLFAHDNMIIDDNFQTYMMYEPPGNDIQWVPLNNMSWAWQCNVNYVNLPGQASYYNPNPPGIISVVSDTQTSNFPIWNNYYPDTSP